MEPSSPSPFDQALADQLAALRSHVYALRAVVQAMVIGQRADARTIAAFDAISARMLAQIAMDHVHHPAQADRPALDTLRDQLSEWREFLSPTTRGGG